MATGNFLNNNASLIYGVEIQEEWDYEDLKENLHYELEQMAKDSKNFQDNVDFTDEYEKDCNRNFPGKVITTLFGKEKYYSRFDVTVNVRIEAIIRSGYYSGVNLDWNAIVECDGELYDMDDEVFLGDEPIAEYTAKLINNWKVKEIAKLTAEIEKVFSQNSINLKVKARFSNGETIYEEVKKTA